MTILLLLHAASASSLSVPESKGSQDEGLGSTAEAEFFFRNWDTQDGLPHGTVNAIAQTPDGYLWVGTRSGLARFDGVQFRVFTPDIAPGLKDNDISALLVDREGALWVGTTHGGLSRHRDGIFTAMDASAIVKGDPIRGLLEDKSGAIWLSAGLKIGRLSVGQAGRRLGEWDNLTPTNRMPWPEEARLTLDNQGKIWLGMRGGVFELHESRWRRESELPEMQFRVDGMAPSREGGIWVGMPAPNDLNRGTVIRKLRGGRWSDEIGPYPWNQDLQQSNLHALWEDRTGGLWLGTFGAGVYRYLSGKGWQLLTGKGPLSQLIITCFFEDRHGSLWIGSQQGGLNQILHKSVTALKLPSPGNDTVILTAAAARDGSVWVGTDGAGAFKYRDRGFRAYGTNAGLTNLHVATILEDTKSNLWFGTWGGLFQLKGERLQPVGKMAALRTVVLSLFEDHAGDLWIGTGGGLVRKHGEVERNYGQEEGLDHFYIRSMAEGRDGELWVGVYDRGVYRLVNDRFELLAGLPQAASVVVRALHCDEQGTLWIATYGEGLFRLKGMRIDKWSVREGLPDDLLNSIIDDAASRLWVGSDSGIFSLSRSALEENVGNRAQPLLCRHLSMADGLAIKVCSGAGQPVAARTKDGRLWFPNRHALAVFDPAGLPPLAAPGPIVVDEVLADGQRQGVLHPKGLRLGSGTKHLEFVYTASDLLAPQQLQFRYKLEGLEDGWVNAGSRRSAYYTDLPPGHYQFQAMTKGLDGVWHGTLQPLRIEIVPRMWETIWFKALACVVLMGAIAGTVRFVTQRRLKRQLEHARMEQAVDGERRRIAQDLHDEVGADLTHLTLLGELARSESLTLPEVRSRVGDFARRSREIVRALDEIVWAMNPRNDSLPRVAAYLQDFALDFFRPSPIRCRLDVADELPAAPLSVQIRHNLLLAVKEAFNNAAKYSGASEVWLRLRCEEGVLRVTVEDNGMGFELAAVKGDHNGLTNLRARMSEIGGRTDITSHPGAGCRVELELPVGTGKTPEMMGLN